MRAKIRAFGQQGLSKFVSVFSNHLLDVLVSNKNLIKVDFDFDFDSGRAADFSLSFSWVTIDTRQSMHLQN